MENQVLQKFIANSGHCSRRKAEAFIKDGRVFVNDKMAELGQRVGSEDEVKVNGIKINVLDEKIYIKLNKPEGYVCTNRRFKDEKNVFELVDNNEKLNIVGRLDKESRGLLLLTNDGDLTQKLTHPKFEHKKTYEVEINEKINKSDIEKAIRTFKGGVDIEDGDGVVTPKEVKYIDNNKFKILLTEGKKRQIRRMFKVVGLKVKDLVRVGIGSLSLGSLKEGEWEYLNEKEIKTLLKK